MVYKTWSSIKVRRSSHWPTCSLLIGCCAALKVVLFRDCCSEVLKLFSRPMGATPHLKLIHRNGRHLWARVTQLLSYSNYADALRGESGSGGIVQILFFMRCLPTTQRVRNDKTLQKRENKFHERSLLRSRYLLNGWEFLISINCKVASFYAPCKPLQGIFQWDYAFKAYSTI